MNFELLKSTVEAAARKLCISEYEIYYKESESCDVGALDGEISSFSSAGSRGVCIRVSSGGRIGYASTELFTEDEISDLVRRAADSASVVEKNETVGIFEGAESYLEPRGKGGEMLSPEMLRSLAKEIGNKAYSISDRVTKGTESSAGSLGFTIRISNSHGLDLENSAGISYVNIDTVVTDGALRESGYEIAEYKPDTDINSVAERAVRTAESRLGASGVKTGKYDIVIEPKGMRQLLSAFVSAFSAKSAQSGLSPLKGREGERIASDIITLTDDPMRDGASVTTPFDAEGYPTRRKAVIEGGVLKTLLYNRESAKKAGVLSTGNGGKGSYSSPVSTIPYAFCIEAGERSTEELYKLCENGLLITDFSGLHAGTNAVTGDFSLESSGYVIRDGAVSEAVKSFTVAGNFFDLLYFAEALSDKTELGVSASFTSFGSPALLVRGMSVAGSE